MSYPNFYQPQYYGQPQSMNMQSMQSPITRSGDFISVPNEDAARNYPVGPGVSMNFKNENAPYIYTKTMGFSQFDRPIFKRYKLIEEETETNPPEPQAQEPIDYVKKNEFNDLQTRIDNLEKEINNLKEGV